MRVRCWAGLHPKTRRIGGRYGCEKAPVVRGTVILVEVGKLPRQTRKPKKLWLWWSGAGEADLDLLWKAYWSQVRPRTHDTLHETNPGLDDAEGAPSRAGRPMDLAGIGRLRPAEAGACHRRRREATLGASATASAVDPDPRPAGFRDSLGGRGHPGEAPETLREVSGAPEGQPLWAGQASPGAQNGRLSKPKRFGSGYVLVFAVLG